MINITINPKYKKGLTSSFIENLVLQVFSHLQIQNDLDLSIVIDSDEFIQCLNRDFRGLDEPTDVLSFPSDEIDPQTNRRYIGDIIISFPRVIEQSTKCNHPTQDELTLLLIHGVLHLLGYDHINEEDKNEMWAIQGELLTKFGCHIDI